MDTEKVKPKTRLSKKKSIELYKKRKINEYYRKKNIEKYYHRKIATEKYMPGRGVTIHQIIDNLARRATQALSKRGIPRSIKHMDLIGCDEKTLQTHLQEKFTNGMNFDNYGEWEIDHIKPIALHDLTKWSEQLECFNYKNLQPLWLKDNRSKSAKFETS